MRIVKRKEAKNMDAVKREWKGQSVLFLPAAGVPVTCEQDALDIITCCAEHEVDKVLISGERLSDDFFRLRTGVAGGVLQKLQQYAIKTAVVMTEERAKGKFVDFLAETNRGNTFRSFIDEEAALDWLIG